MAAWASSQDGDWVSKATSHKSLLEVTLSWKSWGVTSAATVLSLPIFEKTQSPHLNEKNVKVILQEERVGWETML